jgi:hypothetical protein
MQVLGVEAAGGLSFPHSSSQELGSVRFCRSAGAGPHLFTPPSGGQLLVSATRQHIVCTNHPRSSRGAFCKCTVANVFNKPLTVYQCLLL